MTRITEKTISLNCAGFGGESPLPKFRDQQPCQVQHAAPVGLADEEMRDIVDMGALSVLPYLEQNGYDRDRRLRDMHAVLIENDHLRATVLPGLGGRIHSLIDKRRGQELLFANPAIQPVNIGLRNAWFSGGLEWNGGSVPGHAASSCSQVYCQEIVTDRGPIVRLYEFDRISETAWQVDLYMPPDEGRLYVHPRIVNPNDHDKLV